MPRTSTGTGWNERLLRILFGAVVVLFFAGLSIGLASIVALSPPGRVRSATSMPVIATVGVILFLALVAAYGLDQLLSGLWPSRSRWFARAEELLGETASRIRGRGNVTVARIWGAPIRVHWSLPLGFVLVGGLQPGAWVGFLAVVFAHELGHAVLVRRCGQEVVALSLHALGGECQWAGFTTPRQRTLIAWGGVAGQLLLLGVAGGFVLVTPRTFTDSFGNHLWRALTRWNLIMAGLNLLPIPPLDGAEAWRPLFRALRPRPRAEPVGRVDPLVKSVLTKVARKNGPLD